LRNEIDGRRTTIFEFDRDDINHHGDMRSGGQRAARTNVANQTNRNRLVWWTGRYAAERVQRVGRRKRPSSEPLDVKFSLIFLKINLERQLFLNL
jgi:hypothetical protein